MFVRVTKPSTHVFILIVAAGAISYYWMATRVDKIPGKVYYSERDVVQLNDWDLPWYFKGGFIRPNMSQGQDVWPGIGRGDRIVTQLMHLPAVDEDNVKKIYISGRYFFGVDLGNSVFVKSNCPVHNCAVISDDKSADAIIFREHIKKRRTYTPRNQIWILFMMENPMNSGKVRQSDVVNWTASYRSDSEIVAPYAKWVYYDERVKSKPSGINYASGKQRKVAWFVSNCRSQNKRMQFAKELQKYIEVDIYGICGTMRCTKRTGTHCFKMLSRHYKFYLSFENANCIEYITEKFYENALRNDVIPIAMGARKEDYAETAPHHSYIHVEDFPDAKSLADYLHVLDRNDTLYNSYFHWKGTGEFIDTRFFCRLCALMNDPLQEKRYKDFRSWWKKPGTCTQDRWNI